jgi:hypothetical protein
MGVLGRFRYLYDHSHFQRRSATRAFRALCHARNLALQIDIGGYGMRADRTVRQTLRVACHHVHHFSVLPTWSDAKQGQLV